GEIRQPKRRQVLLDHAAQILISRDLVRLREDAPLPMGLDDLEVCAPEPAVLLDFLTRMEFRTLSKRVAGKLGVEPPAIPEPPAAPATAGAPAPAAEPEAQVPFDHAAYACITDAATLADWVAEIADKGWVAIDTETTSLDEMRAELVGISLCV